MQEDDSPQYICPVCREVRTEMDIRDGLAVRRGAEVYCLEHFRRAFPWDCPNHPGTEGTGICTGCGGVVCDDCSINIAHHRICASCKPHWLGRMKAGKTPPPFGVGKDGDALLITIKGRATHAVILIFLVLAVTVWGTAAPFFLAGAGSVSWFLILYAAAGLAYLAYVCNSIRYLNETIRFDARALSRKRGNGPFKTKEMSTSDVGSFILRPAGPGSWHEWPRSFHVNNRRRLFLFATSEKVPPNRLVMKELPFWTHMRESFSFFKKPKLLLLAIQAGKEELPYLQNILAKHLRRLRASAGEQPRG
jgi:hypothetical protein